jgi:hypothetical protein
MKTALDVTTKLYQRLYASSTLRSTITGAIYRDERLDSSVLEDIVINCLPVSDGQPQLATANINLHVPDLKIGSGTHEGYVPNHSRIKTILAILIPLVNVVRDGDYRFHVESQTLLREKQRNESVYNIRIELFILNT